MVNEKGKGHAKGTWERKRKGKGKGKRKGVKVIRGGVVWADRPPQVEHLRIVCDSMEHQQRGELRPHRPILLPVQSTRKWPGRNSYPTIGRHASSDIKNTPKRIEEPHDAYPICNSSSLPLRCWPIRNISTLGSSNLPPQPEPMESVF